MELKMASSPAAATDLPASDNTMSTGYMGDCVSTIVLFNFSGGSYSNVRGYHGNGGIEYTNWESLFKDVPNDATTKIIVISGTLNKSSFRNDENEKEARAQADKYKVREATFEFHHTKPIASVDRRGDVTFP